MNTENPCTCRAGLPEGHYHDTALIDGRTGLVIDDTEDSCDHSQKTLASGFGPAVKLLEVESFRLAPWMTPELAEQEIAMQGTKGS